MLLFDANGIYWRMNKHIEIASIVFDTGYTKIVLWYTNINNICRNYQDLLKYAIRILMISVVVIIIKHLISRELILMQFILLKY